MKNKKHTRMAILISVVLILVISGTAITLGAGRTALSEEPPQITVMSEHEDISWIVGINKWNGNAYDRLDSLKILQKQEYISNGDIPYVKNGEQITIKIDGNIPDTTALTEYILNEDRKYKYDVYGTRNCS